jgi:hypothetical protein
MRWGSGTYGSGLGPQMKASGSGVGQYISAYEITGKGRRVMPVHMELAAQTGFSAPPEDR